MLCFVLVSFCGLCFVIFFEMLVGFVDFGLVGRDLGLVDLVLELGATGTLVLGSLLVLVPRTRIATSHVTHDSFMTKGFGL